MTENNRLLSCTEVVLCRKEIFSERADARNSRLLYGLQHFDSELPLLQTQGSWVRTDGRVAAPLSTSQEPRLDLVRGFFFAAFVRFGFGAGLTLRRSVTASLKFSGARVSLLCFWLLIVHFDLFSWRRG